MMRPKNPDTPPRGLQWNWVCEESGYKISHIHRDECRKMAREYCIRNNYPIGSNWEVQFDDNICRNTYDGVNCIDSEPPTLAQRLVKFSQAMAQWGKAGFPLATPEVVEQRKSTCEVCYYYSGSSSLLKIGCKKCGCSGVALYLETQKCPDNRW